MRIGIVNDSAIATEALRRVISSAPDHVVAWAAVDGSEAVRRCAEERPDLVLMDFSLPGMDGLSATKNLKTDPTTRHLAVVGLSANAMKGDQEIALEAGCDGYLTKPIDTRTFATTVKKFIAGKFN